MPAVIAREPPPLKHTATLPGVSVLMNEPTVSGGVRDEISVVGTHRILLADRVFVALLFFAFQKNY